MIQLFIILMEMVSVSGQGSEASRSYYQGQRPELRMAVEKQCSYGEHSQPRGGENMRFGENPPPHTFEGVEQKFLDDIMKLSDEQNNAEDAEYSRHWEVSSVGFLLKDLSLHFNLFPKAHVEEMPVVSTLFSSSLV